jgi:predicted amidohydrolase YtcJ
MKILKSLLLIFSPLLLTAQVNIYFNARIFTANTQQPYADAIAISGKKILAVGLYSEVKKAAGPAATLTDCQGAFLMPGFVDSHIHAISGGRGLTKANTSDKLLRVEELEAYGRNKLQKKEGMTGDVLVIYGINISTWAYLDEIRKLFNEGEFAIHPVLLRGSDGHTSWANNVLMKRAGLDKKFIQSLKPEEKQTTGEQLKKPWNTAGHWASLPGWIPAPAIRKKKNSQPSMPMPG